MQAPGIMLARLQAGEIRGSHDAGRSFGSDELSAGEGPSGAASGNETAVADLQEVRALLAAVVDSSEDAVVSKTLQGVVTSWNAAAERLFGWTAAEMVGQPILRVIPE